MCVSSSARTITAKAGRLRGWRWDSPVFPGRARQRRGCSCWGCSAPACYGDAAIAPAISVLSAVEGLHIAAPHLSALVLPITLLILTVLFAIQRYGAQTVGALFGPVMLLWFIT